jgi:hypothetical protein
MKCFRSEASRGFCFLAIPFLVTALLFPIAGLAQTNTGRLVGTVYDQAGAVVPGAAIVVTDARTNKERSSVSDESGSFTIPLLDVGTYTVKVTKEGFKTYTSTDVVIQVGREYPLRVVLEVGAPTTVVEVSEGIQQVTATSGELSTTITTKQIQELPLDARNPLSLTLMMAGSSSNSAQNTSINGQRTAWTNITRDGINIQDAFIRSNATDFAPGRPSTDDTEEITLSTQNAGADAGNGGAQIRLVTPRGSTAYHGSAWEYNRNSAYAANSFFNNRSGSPLPFRNRNNFGGRVGGKVPKTGEKLFFFGFYEGLRDRVVSENTRTLLRPDARNGIFTYVDSSGVTRNINLFSLVPSITGIDPTINSQVLAKMPTEGNRSDIGDKLNTIGYQLNQPSNATRDTVTTRIDFDLNSNHNFNVVFTRNKETNQRPDVNNTEGFYPVHPVDQSSTNTQFAAAHRWLISGKFTNEIRGGFFFSDVPFNRLSEKPAYFIIPSSIISNPEVTFLDQGRKVRSYNLQDNAEKMVGSHSLRFGGMMQMFQVDPYNYASIVPTWSTGTNANTPSLTTSMFPGGISTSQLSTANGLFSTLGGIISSGTQSFNVQDKTSGFAAVPRLEDYRYSNYSFYGNDQWRVTPDLTVNLGLRYEILTPARLLNGLGLEVVIPDGADPLSTILSTTGTYNYVGGNAGNNRLFKTDWNNFAPVVSFAYSPKSQNAFVKAITGKDQNLFVIRGGFRQSFVNDSNLTASRNAMNGNAGMATTAVAALNPATGTSSLNARLNALPTINPPTLLVPRTFAQNNTASFNYFGTVFGVDPNIQTTRINEYNLSIQRPLGWGTVLEVRYVGSSSNDLWRVIDYNQIDIRNNGFADDFNRARQNLVSNGNANVGLPLTVFPLLTNGGNLTNSTNRTYLLNGTPADMALSYIQQAQTGSVKFLPNTGTGVADLLRNGSKYRYNSLQIDARKQFSKGFYFQANFTWQKTLTDSIGTSQTLVDTILDLQNPQLEYTRADYDTSRIFNVNAIYDLPFGKGKLVGGGVPEWANKIIGGWRLSGISRITSGTPITIVDARGTLNRAARSARQTPDLQVSFDQMRSLVGRYENSNGIYFINPSAVNPTTGRGAEGYGSAPFAGQVFFNAAPGKTGNMGRAVLDGPMYFGLDLALLKDIVIHEQVGVQLRMDAYNVFNHTNFYASQLQSINSANFGKLLSTWSPRVVQIAARLNF